MVVAKQEPARKEGTVNDNRHSVYPAKIVGWPRTGYPLGLPGHDYVPLGALPGNQFTDES